MQSFHFLAVLEQRAIRIDLDAHASLRAFLGELLEIFGALTLRRVDGDDVTEFDDDRLLRCGVADCETQRAKAGEQ